MSALVVTTWSSPFTHRWTPPELLAFPFAAALVTHYLSTLLVQVRHCIYLRRAITASNWSLVVRAITENDARLRDSVLELVVARRQLESCDGGTAAGTALPSYGEATGGGGWW